MRLCSRLAVHHLVPARLPTLRRGRYQTDRLALLSAPFRCSSHPPNTPSTEATTRTDLSSSSSPVSSASPTPAPEKEGKIRSFWKKYGRLGLGLYAGIYLLGIPAFYLLVQSGVLPIDGSDLQQLVVNLGLQEYVGTIDLSQVPPERYSLALAVVINELVEVLRLPLAIFLTVRIRRARERRTSLLEDKPT